MSLRVMKMIRVYVILAIIAITNISSGFIAYRLTSAHYINQENKLIIKEVEKYNDNLKRLEASTKKLEAIKAGVHTEIRNIPAIDNHLRCPVDDIVRLRNEAYRTLPDVYFQGAKPLPTAD